jgi:hypothetical protein
MNGGGLISIRGGPIPSLPLGTKPEELFIDGGAPCCITGGGGTCVTSLAYLLRIDLISSIDKSSLGCINKLFSGKLTTNGAFFIIEAAESLPSALLLLVTVDAAWNNEGSLLVEMIGF